MSIKRRIKVKRTPKPTDPLSRMGDILAAGHGNEKQAFQYFELIGRDRAARLQSIVARAEREHSWDFMEGSFKHATEIYVVASVLYEKHPECVVMTDGAFDALAKFLLKHYDKLGDDFTNWYAITTIDLAAGTGHAVQEDTMVRATVNHIVNEAANERPRVLRNKTKRRVKGASGSSRDEAGKPVRRIKIAKRTGAAKAKRKHK